MYTKPVNSYSGKCSRTFFFEVHGGRVGHAFASIEALNLESAHTLMSALFPGSEVATVEAVPVMLHH
jgi:hypothetical protein